MSDEDFSNDEFYEPPQPAAVWKVVKEIKEKLLQMEASLERIARRVEAAPPWEELVSGNPDGQGAGE
jgi:hypothetical protein